MNRWSRRARAIARRLPGALTAKALLDRATGAREEHWVRVVMNRETRRLVEELGPERLDALEISGDRWQGLLPFRSYRQVSYPELDICQATLPERFDLILAEQVFEHLLWPYRAGRHIFEMLRPEGAFLITTPFLICVHEYPVDCSRWTETGLRYFLAECGFDLDCIRTGSWGNRACVRTNFRAFVPYRSRLHSLANEPNYPAVVWALARKGSE